MSTELDMSGYTGHKPSEPCVDSLTSGWSSVTASDTTIPASLLSDLDGMKLEKGRLERYAADAGDLRHVSPTSGWSSVTASDTTIPTSLLSDLNSLKLEKGRLEAHVISLREKIIATTLEKIESSKNVDFCYVLDCTGSMSRHISAAKDCIVQVVNYMERTNPSIKIRIGFCGYRDHCDGDDRIQIFDFTDSYEEFRNYISSKVPAKGGGDGPEDVLGGLNAAITQMNWRNTTRILFHVGDCPPHGRRFSDLRDDYKEGDPNGLTAESVLEMMRTSNILYFFGKVTHNTDKMLNVFRDIIGEIPVFNFDNVELISRYSQATCSAITSSVTLTSTVDNDLYFLRRKELDINPDEPDWSTLKEQTGTVLYYHSPKTLADIQNKKYFNKSNPVSQNISFKIASHPFSVGAERYAYFALDVKHEPMKKIVVKEYREIGRKANSVERYLEAVEVSAIARFLSTEFNSAAKRVGIHKKVKFLQAKLLRSTIGSDTQYYSVEQNISNIKYKRFNVNSGVITEFHSTLEAFAHFTYDYTGGYLLVYDLQGAELSNKFILTDPAIQCIDSLRFGKTNLGEKGIKRCFLENHKCSSVCKKLGLDVKK